MQTLRRAMARRALAVALTISACGAVAAPLTLDAALSLAERNAPSLAAQNARIDAARAAAIPAGELPDPKLILALDNVPISGPDRLSLRRDFMTMQRVGLMQEVPNRAKRRARVDQAEAAIARTEIERTTELLNIRRETALAWIGRLTAERKLAIFTEFERENTLLADAVRARIAGGRGRPAEGVMPRQEALALAARRDELITQRRRAAAALQRWIGAEYDATPAGDWPTWPVTRATLQQRFAHHPELTAFEPMLRMADAEVREAEAGKTPDWGVELAYQKRGEPYDDMVSVQLSFDLPVFAARRQDPRIAEKRAERLRLASEREAVLRAHAEMLEADLSEYERLERAVQRQRDTLLPLLQEKIALSLASYRASTTELTELIAARRELIEERLKLVELEGARAQTAARLHFTYGQDTK